MTKDMSRHKDSASRIGTILSSSITRLHTSMKSLSLTSLTRFRLLCLVNANGAGQPSQVTINSTVIYEKDATPPSQCTLCLPWACAFASTEDLEIVELSVNSSCDISTGYRFRTWHYVTADVRLVRSATLEPVCLDTGCSLSLVDRAWLKKTAPDVEIRTMATPITVRGIGQNKHEYVILLMMF
jgi:hypothetical protein